MTLIKQCPQCAESKPLDEFYVNKRTGKPHSWCRICNKRKTNERYANDKARGVAYQMKYYGRKTKEILTKRKAGRVGLSAEEYAALDLSRCEICAVKLNSARGKMVTPQLDHDHATGKFRGVLCSFCNLSLGLVKDNEQTLVRMAEYLKERK